MTTELILLFDALAVATTAAWIDVQQHRIPNSLTYPAILAGVLLRCLYFGGHGMVTALLGLGLTLLITFVFFLVRAMGGGDVKLLLAIGAFVGPKYAITVLLATAICGGVLALAYAAYRRRLGATLTNLGNVVKFHATSGLQVHPEINLENPEALRIPYGLAIAAGTVYAFWTAWVL